MNAIQNSASRYLGRLGLAFFLMTMCLMSTPNPANASIVIGLEDSDLVKNASVVVYARIGTSESLQFGTRIATCYQIEVLEMIKGEAEITEFLTRGGQMDDFVQTVIGEASFSQNQEAVLFLEPIKAYESKLLLVGLSQGAVYVDDVENAKPPLRMLKTQNKKRIRRAENNRLHIQSNGEPNSIKIEDLDLDAYLANLRILVKNQNAVPLSSHKAMPIPKTLVSSQAQPNETP